MARVPTRTAWVSGRAGFSCFLLLRLLLLLQCCCVRFCEACWLVARTWSNERPTNVRPQTARQPCRHNEPFKRICVAVTTDSAAERRSWWRRWWRWRDETVAVVMTGFRPTRRVAWDICLLDDSARRPIICVNLCIHGYCFLFFVFVFCWFGSEL